MSVFQQTTEGSLSVAVKQTLAHTCSHDAASSRLSIQKIKMPRTPKPKHAPRQISMAQPLHGPLLFAWPSEVAARAKSMLPRRGYRFPSCMHPDHCPHTHAAVVWLTTHSGARQLQDRERQTATKGKENCLHCTADRPSNIICIGHRSLRRREDACPRRGGWPEHTKLLDIPQLLLRLQLLHCVQRCRALLHASPALRLCVTSHELPAAGCYPSYLCTAAAAAVTADVPHTANAYHG